MRRILLAALIPVFGFVQSAPAQDVARDLSGFVGQRLLLRGYGDNKEATLDKNDLLKPAGTCDAAIEVMKVEQAGDRLRLVLEQIGQPAMAVSAGRCLMRWTEATLTITGLVSGDSAATLEAMLRNLLMSPEAYLAHYGITPGPPAAGPGLTRPKVLLRVSPSFTDQARKARQGGTVQVEVTIGADGRVYMPRIVKGVGLGLDEQSVRVLSLWRFEPPRRDGVPIDLKLVMEHNFSLR